MQCTRVHERLKVLVEVLDEFLVDLDFVLQLSLALLVDVDPATQVTEPFPIS